MDSALPDKVSSDIYCIAMRFIAQTQTINKAGGIALPYSTTKHKLHLREKNTQFNR